MNYFAHALTSLDAPYRMAGTMAPDWLGAADRRVRFRPPLVRDALDHPDERVRQLATGLQRHWSDDGWFHQTRAFHETSSELAILYRSSLRIDEYFRASLLGHVSMELLIDGLLAERYPDRLREVYVNLAGVDRDFLVDSLLRLTRGTTDRLGWFLEIFLSERFLEDYGDDDRLAYRLNQVWHRIKLGPLPAELPAALAIARRLVRGRLDDLLPPDRYPWPPAPSGSTDTGIRT